MTSDDMPVTCWRGRMFGSVQPLDLIPAANIFCVGVDAHAFLM